MAEAQHPLESLTHAEVKRCINILRDASHIKSSTRVVQVVLIEPTKEFVFGWKEGDNFGREAEVTLFDNSKNACSKAGIDLTVGSIKEVTEIPGVQPLITVDEMEECEKVVVESEEFKKKVLEHFGDHPAAKMENLICDIWSAGWYGDESLEGLRLARPLCFFKNVDDENPYAYPIEGLRPVVDLNSMTLLRVEDYGKWPLPPPHYGKHRASKMAAEMRKDIKPLEIEQKEGPSFKVNGKSVQWQKWSFVVGFNAKEGLTLHDVRYDGRSILFRAAISDMVVPYGDPATQQARKNAFDVSDYGIGYCTNSLKLGCDCLGEIHYFDGELVTSRGESWTLEQAVCMHEEDYGVVWKHFDRHSDSREIRRSRRLVVSTFATVENYDYGFYWYFYQDGNIQLEVKLTGFLSVGAWRPDDAYPQHGSLVAPQVYAPHHQHFFNFRLDFAIDGIRNTVSQVDVVGGTNNQENAFHNAFYAKKTPYKTEEQAKSNVCVESSRSWEVSNEGKKNLVGMPVAYKLIPGENSVPFATPEAWWRKRARFVDHHVWVTPFNKAEYCCAGDFPNQNKQDHGLIEWTAQNRKIDNEDCVLWYTFGVTHITRPEDYPVMPTVYTGFYLKPSGFFDKNPAYDVPPQCDVNKWCGGSRLARV